MQGFVERNLSKADEIHAGVDWVASSELDDAIAISCKVLAEDVRLVPLPIGDDGG